MEDLDRLGLIGQTVDGRYTILEQIGQGGMGAVYRAEHQRLGRQVAIKFLHQRYAKDHESLDRFFNEARAAATLGHPNIAESFDVGELSDGSPFIVLELLHGRSLHEEVGRAGQLSIPRALRIARQIAQGIDAAHQRGIVHRDLKSENVFLTERPDTLDHVKILDFGVARILENSAGLTQPGQLIGTPEVMPPEQILSAHTVDARVDIYATGVILYQMLSGRKPFASVPLPALLHLILEEPPPPLTFLPDDVRALVEDAMARDRDFRIQTAVELRDRIDACVAARPGAPQPVPVPEDIDRPGPTPADVTSPSLLAKPMPPVVQRRGGDGRYHRVKIRAVGTASAFAVAAVTFALIYLTIYMPRPSMNPATTAPGPSVPGRSAPVVAMVPVEVPVAPSRGELSPRVSVQATASAPGRTPTAAEPAGTPTTRPTHEPAVEIDPPDRRHGVAGALRPKPTRSRGTSRMHTEPRSAAHAVDPPAELAAPVTVPDARALAAAAPALGATPPAEAAAATPPAPAIKKDEIDAAVSSHGAAIEQCYDRARMDDPGLAGRMTVQITIGPDGAVTGAEVMHSTIRSAAVERCVTGEIARWRLPRPSGGHAASFQFYTGFN